MHPVYAPNAVLSTPIAPQARHTIPIDSLSMIAQVRKLRRGGVRLPAAKALETWSQEGYLELLPVTGSRSRTLQLRALGATPGFGILEELFCAQLITMGDRQMRFRGVESAPTAQGDAAVVQEWIVRLTR